jgi:2-oxoglutarate dehydrogenase E2 component (dihydrolipoamide succinyltransferase)
MTQALEIRAPAEQTEGTRSQVLRWLKNVGETVAENEPLIEIETDKVTVEVASPGAGILREIVKGEQEEIAPGEVLGRIEMAEAAPSAGGGDAASDGGVGLPPEGGGVSLSEVYADARARGGLSNGAAHGAVGASVTVSASEVRAAVAKDNFAAARFSPAVRRLLNENSLDPATVRGTGLGGRITVEDILAAIAARAGAPSGQSASTAGLATARSAPAAAGRESSAAVAPTAPAPAPAGATSSDVAGGSRLIPHSTIRKRVAEHMVQSLLHTAPHVTTVFEVDMSAVLAHRLQHRDEFARRGAPLTLTAYFLQATVDAIRAVPEANSRWTDNALEVFESIHIGVGTALEEGGLVVPVLRDVQARDLFSTAEGLNDLVTRAREGRLVPADVRGGTFTISNHGVSGSLVATPIIINQPQSAILGIGKLEKRAVVVEEGGADQVVIRPRCYVTLTIDHRVMDGHQANHFLATFVARLTRWPL